MYINRRWYNHIEKVTFKEKHVWNSIQKQKTNEKKTHSHKQTEKQGVTYTSMKEEWNKHTHKCTHAIEHKNTDVYTYI